jgi:hypothetical protein
MTDAEMIEILRGRIEQLMETQELLVAQRNAAWERDTYSFKEWKAAEAKLAKAVVAIREMMEDAEYPDAVWEKGTAFLTELEMV